MQKMCSKDFDEWRRWAAALIYLVKGKMDFIYDVPLHNIFAVFNYIYPESLNPGSESSGV